MSQYIMPQRQWVVLKKKEDKEAKNNIGEV